MSAVYGPQIFLMLASALARRAPALDVQAALTEATHQSLHDAAEPKIEVVAVMRGINVNVQHLLSVPLLRRCH